jgi:hypothetical protein
MAARSGATVVATYMPHTCHQSKDTVKHCACSIHCVADSHAAMCRLQQCAGCSLQCCCGACTVQCWLALQLMTTEGHRHQTLRSPQAMLPGHHCQSTLSSPHPQQQCEACAGACAAAWCMKSCDPSTPLLQLHPHPSRARGNPLRLVTSQVLRRYYWEASQTACKEANRMSSARDDWGATTAYHVCGFPVIVHIPLVQPPAPFPHLYRFGQFEILAGQPVKHTRSSKCRLLTFCSISGVCGSDRFRLCLNKTAYAAVVTRTNQVRCHKPRAANAHLGTALQYLP